jgi:hypothetical protein
MRIPLNGAADAAASGGISQGKRRIADGFGDDRHPIVNHPGNVGPKQKRKETEMGRQIAVVLYVVAMVAVIVGVDVVFFRNRFWERLTVNIGIVLVFGAFYLRFLRS